MADQRRTLDREARDRPVTEGHGQATHGDESLVMVERELSDQAIYKQRERVFKLRRERREKQLLAGALFHRASADRRQSEL